MRLLMLAYDFEGHTIHDKKEVEWKLARDGYKANDEVLLVCWSRRRETLALSPHITVESFPGFAGKFRPLYDFLFLLIAPFSVWRHMFRPDRIHIGEWPLAWGAGAVRLFFGGEVVVRLIGLPRHIARTRGPFHYLYTVFNEYCAGRIPDRCVAISDATAEYAIARGMSRGRVFLLPLDSIRADAAYIKNSQRGVVRAHLGIPETVPIIISVGRLEAEKAFDELISVFAESHIEARLVILGEGSLRNHLEKLANEKAPGKVIFAGKKGREEIWNYYRDASAFALLSISEGLGLVFWEAMYVGVPVIGRPVGGIINTIGSDGTRGFFWDTKDGATVFKEKISQCFSNGPQVESMKERARVYVEAQIREMSGERPF